MTKRSKTTRIQCKYCKRAFNDRRNFWRDNHSVKAFLSREQMIEYYNIGNDVLEGTYEQKLETLQEQHLKSIAQRDKQIELLRTKNIEITEKYEKTEKREFT